ncbi:MAG TPA: hypothetical protein VGQ12_08075 [Candidatus Angelobacter sp.]|jgi:hypothetical protein|nr:hypothetical protein [Candidatus Angelobacter sp.]
METEEIISALEHKRDRLDRVIELLRDGSSTGRQRYKYRTAEQRRTISDGMKKHWIERRKKMAAGQVAEG